MFLKKYGILPKNVLECSEICINPGHRLHLYLHVVVADVCLQLLDDLVSLHQLLRHRLHRRLQLRHVSPLPLQLFLKPPLRGARTVITTDIGAEDHRRHRPSSPQSHQQHQQNHIFAYYVMIYPYYTLCMTITVLI